MRTTVELPPALMRAAKARSAERGESLKTFLSRAVAAELGADAPTDIRTRRVVLPLFGDASGLRVDPSSTDLERAIADEDRRRVGSRPPSFRRRSKSKSR